MVALKFWLKLIKNDVVVVDCWWNHYYMIWILLGYVSDDNSCIGCW